MNFWAVAVVPVETNQYSISLHFGADLQFSR